MRNVSTVAIRGGFCGICYAESIDRVCSGITIPRHDGKGFVILAPLPPGTAVSVRKAAREYLAEHGQGDDTRHPQHGAAGLL